MINFNTYFISSNIIFISKSSSEWVSELRFNILPTTRSYGDGTSVTIIFFIHFNVICLNCFCYYYHSLKKTCTESSFCKSLYLTVKPMVVSLKNRHANALVVSLDFCFYFSQLVVCLFFFSCAKEFLLGYSELLKTIKSVYNNIQILFLAQKSPGTRLQYQNLHNA